MKGLGLGVSAGVVVWVACAVLMVGPCEVYAGDGEGHGPGSTAFPSHDFTVEARSAERPQLNVHFGLSQPLLLDGFNVAADVRVGRWVFEYSHGVGLDYTASQTVADSFGLEAGLSVESPWTTGAGVGYTLMDELVLMVEFKAHHYELGFGASRADYTTVSVGPALAWRFFIWRGLNITAYLRYWPNVFDTEGGGSVELTDGERTVSHDPIDLGLFANLSLGWAFDL